MTGQIPSVGRVVHYVSYGTPDGEYTRECRAAIITEVPEGVANPQTVGLCVLNPAGQFFNRTIPYDAGRADLSTRCAESPPAPALCDGKWHAGGTWHWPERVLQSPQLTDAPQLLIRAYSDDRIVMPV